MNRERRTYAGSAPIKTGEPDDVRRATDTALLNMMQAAIRDRVLLDVDVEIKLGQPGDAFIQNRYVVCVESMGTLFDEA